MLRSLHLLLFSLLGLLPGCTHSDGLQRVEVRGKVTFQGSPVNDGFIAFRPASGSKGPATGTDIVAGTFVIPIEKGPTAGPHEVEVKILNAASDSSNSKNFAPAMRNPAQLKSFSQHVDIVLGVNEFEFAFPLPPPAEKNRSN